MNRLFAFLFVLLAGAPPALADFEAAAEYSAGLRGISLLVIEDGEVAFEDYPNDGAEDRAQPLASGTKSFIGILAAAAVQDDLITLDEPVADTITEWQGSPREQVTVRQLLNLTAGFPRPRRAARVPPYGGAIRAPLTAAPGTSFIYSPVPFQIFGELIKRKIERDPVDYLTERVLEPIGLEVAHWRRDRWGNSTMPTGAHLTARNWARLGEFVLARGEWEGEQLVDPDAFEELFVGSDANPAYGVTWWLIEPVAPRFAAQTEPLDSSTDFWHYPEVFPEDMVMAAGAGDQRLMVSWERNIVVVRQAEGILGALLGHELSWSDVQFWRLLDAPPGERPEPLPPVEVDLEEAPPRGATVELPSGAIVQLPPVARSADDEESEETGDDDFVGPTF